jgi:hypothetical protein
MSSRADTFRILQYVDPEAFLERVQALNAQISRSGLRRAVRTLRTPELKVWREVREAALFAYAIGLHLGQRVLVAKAASENLDYDCVTLREGPANTAIYGAVQIKEVVPHHLNRAASIQQIIDKLTRYNSPDLSVVIHLNRLVEFAPAELKIPKLRLSALWVMAAVTPDQSRWALWGNFLTKDLGAMEFEYPTAVLGSPPSGRGAGGPESVRQLTVLPEPLRVKKEA